MMWTANILDVVKICFVQDSGEPVQPLSFGFEEIIKFHSKACPSGRSFAGSSTILGVAVVKTLGPQDPARSAGQLEALCNRLNPPIIINIINIGPFWNVQLLHFEVLVGIRTISPPVLTGTSTTICALI